MDECPPSMENRYMDNPHRPVGSSAGTDADGIQIGGSGIYGMLCSIFVREWVGAIARG